MTRPLCVAVLLAAVGCSDSGLEPVTAEFGPFELATAEEVSDLCASYTLGNDETLYINAVELTAGFGFHHSNWLYVPQNLFKGPDGTWPCEERGYSQFASARGGVLFAQSTQVTSERQQFPEGAAIAIPPRSKIVGEIHMLNATGASLTTGLRLDLYPLEASSVDVRLAPLALQYESLAIPPMRRSRFVSECDFAAEHERQLLREIDFSLYYILPHYHDLGRGMRIERIADNGDAEVLFENEAAIGEPLGKMLDPPVSMASAQSLRFSCTYDNPRDSMVRWGIGDQEMCVFLGFTDSELQFGGGVIGNEGENRPTETDSMIEFESDCRLISTLAN